LFLPPLGKLPACKQFAGQERFILQDHPTFKLLLTHQRAATIEKMVDPAKSWE
jgi:hypothetical protein